MKNLVHYSIIKAICFLFIFSSSGFIYGQNNTFLGTNAGNGNQGIENVSIGYNANRSVISGSHLNVSVGDYAGQATTTGDFNTFIGKGAGYKNTTGSYNTSLGFHAGFNNLTGIRNVFLGSKAGFYETGNDKLYIDNSLTTNPLIYGDFTNGSEKVIINGDLTIMGMFSTSDKRFKKDIKPITNAGNILSQLEGVRYLFDTEKFKAEDRYFPITKQIGFIAQDVQEILPELVKEDRHGYLSVSYTSIIPILVEGYKDLKATNEELITEIETIKKMIAEMSQNNTTKTATTVTDATLYQNAPNPFSESTIIKYYLPESCSATELLIYDGNGKLIKSIPNLATGNSSVKIEAHTLTAGMYHYKLVCNGRTLDTKSMIKMK